MKESISRRRLIAASLAGGVGTALVAPLGALLGKEGVSAGSHCVTLCDHWSYTGIGWRRSRLPGE
jgi:hypothetical protein